ncbi:MAG: hypothetical protein JNL70_01640 [Saprospiraceae bacterium]|nr:hypothetical protein [Saprospiraceae bacterium]
MGQRYFNFEIADNSVRIYFGDWLMLLYYAKELSYEKFISLFEASFSTNSFNEIAQNWVDIDSLFPLFKRKNNELVDSELVSFSTVMLNDAIQLIDLMIENLKSEKTDLLVKYGGELSFIKMIDKDRIFFSLFLYENDTYLDNEFNIFMLQLLKDKIFLKCLESKMPYVVYID